MSNTSPASISGDTGKQITTGEWNWIIARLTGDISDTTATPGNCTSNTYRGRCAIAAGAKAITVTNSLVTATSMVFAELQTVDGTFTQILTVVPGSGSFVITGDVNATAAVNICWFVSP